MDTRVYPNTQLFINGEWRAARSGRTMPVVNPASGDTIGSLAFAERADLDEALEAAARGFETWKKVSAYERSKIMRKAGAPTAESSRRAPRASTSSSSRSRSGRWQRSRRGTSRSTRS